MIWTHPQSDTWLSPGYRIYQSIRGYSAWCWTPQPLKHLGFCGSLAAAQQVCEQHESPVCTP